MKLTCLLLAAAVMSIVAVENAAAQKKNYICAPGGVEKCVATCNSRGGQIRRCPGWCSKQKQERCR